MQGNVFIFTVVRYKKSQQRGIITSFLAVLKSGVRVILCQTWNGVSEVQTLKHSKLSFKWTIKTTSIYFTSGNSYHISVAFHHVSSSSLLSCNEIIFFLNTILSKKRLNSLHIYLKKSNIWNSFSHNKSYLSSWRNFLKWACLSVRSSFLLDLSDC